MNAILVAGLKCQYINGDGLTARAALPERIVEAAEERTNAKWYPSLVIGLVDGEKSNIVSFGKLDNGTVPDRRSVYEIGSITKTFTAALLAQDILSSRVKLDSAVMDLLPGFHLPSRNGKQITWQILRRNLPVCPTCLPISPLPTPPTLSQDPM